MGPGGGVETHNRRYASVLIIYLKNAALLFHPKLLSMLEWQEYIYVNIIAKDGERIPERGVAFLGSWYVPFFRRGYSGC